MPQKKFKCTRCGKSFSMAAHLGRHMTTIHASPNARKARRPLQASVPRRSSASGGTANILNDMQAYHADLLLQRDQVDSEISALETAMGALDTKGTGTIARTKSNRAKRAPRAGSIKTFIVKALGRKPLSPRDIAAKIKAAGYKSKSSDLTKAVSNALPEVEQAKKIGFGKYVQR